MKLLTVPAAKEEIRRLQNFLKLVENYEANNLEKWIIKEYAFTSCIKEVTKQANERGFTTNGIEINQQFVKNIIYAGNPRDELHRLVRANYRQRIKRS
jgi:hypothetical protein